MAIIIKGRATKKLFPKSTPKDDNGYKIYAFAPNETKGLYLNDYGNISITGILPELILHEKEYEFEVEYESKGKYQSYKVTKMLSSMKPSAGNEAMVFLSEITSPTRAKNILAVYPNFVDMVMNDEKISSQKINGVGDKTLTSLIKKVKSQFIYYDLITEYKDYGLTIAQIKKIYASYNSVEEIREKMAKNPYGCLCSVGGIGFKTADAKILANNEKFRNSPYRMSECILYCLGQNEINGHTYILADDLYSECKELTPECMEYFYRALENSVRIFYHEDRMRVAKMSTYQCEREIAEMLINMRNTKTVWKDCDGVPLNPNNIDEKYKEVNGFKLTEDQCKTIPALIENNIVVLAGYAGAGKSASCQAAINWLEDNCKSYLLVAPTGRAASVLSGYTDRPASTIHRALGAKGEYHFEYNQENKLIVDVVIVDETSMVDTFLMTALLRALPEWCKILFIADAAQIPSVGAGNVIQDIIRSRKFPVIMLDKIFRYGEGGLSYVATKTRKGESFLSTDKVQIFGTNEDYVFEDVDDEDCVNMAVKKYIKLINDGESVNNIVIISCYNKGKYGTFLVNNTIQDIINPKKNQYDGRVGHTKDNVNIMFNIDDRVMMTKNNYHMEMAYEDEECEVFNGDFGTVKQITDEGDLICEFADMVRFSRQDVSDLLLGYSVSCHKMQGDNRKHVILVTPKSHAYMLNRNLLYVALTRSKYKLYHYGNRETINKCLKKSENLSRKTFLEQLLKNCENN